MPAPEPELEPEPVLGEGLEVEEGPDPAWEMAEETACFLGTTGFLPLLAPLFDGVPVGVLVGMPPALELPAATDEEPPVPAGDEFPATEAGAL